MEGRGSRPYRTTKYDENSRKQQQTEEVVEPEDTIKSHSNVSTVEQEPFMGMKVRRRSSMYRLYKGDYIDAASNEPILKLLTKQGDRQVLFAENIVKVTRKGRIARCTLLITDVALYILDAESFSTKRRVSLFSIGKVCLSECSDNFFAIVIPQEYDTLLASARKSEIVTVLTDARKKIGNPEPLEVSFSNHFEYYIDSEHIREVITEQIEGGVKTRFVDR
ncbi:hypothetical protein R1sor_021952 [Riccia sorocarpa]|uniref:TH1 domain-containing protein n=1 Tax=Riccia sorocarpa TaxID=122646 RepID=A0ABD3GK05_9MARC